MVICDRCRIQLKIDVSDVTLLSVVLKLLVQQLWLSNHCDDVLAVVLQLWLDLSCALCGKQMLSCLLLFMGILIPKKKWL